VAAAAVRGGGVTDDVTLYLGDCLDVLRDLPDGSVDAVVTDPPYPNLTGGYVRDVRFGGLADPISPNVSVGPIWGRSLEWTAEAWRVARYGLMIFCSFKDVVAIRAAFPDANEMGLCVWYTRNAAPTGKNVPRHDVQFIWLLSKAPGIKWDALHTMLFDIPAAQAGCFASERVLIPGTTQAAHPCQKPVALMHRLLLDGCATVLDPFMGSGTTGVACVQTGRRFIGVEIDPTYYAIAERRIAEARAQLRLPLAEGVG
jgi:DNA modification methylase